MSKSFKEILEPLKRKKITFSTSAQQNGGLITDVILVDVGDDYIEIVEPNGTIKFIPFYSINWIQ